MAEDSTTWRALLVRGAAIGVGAAVTVGVVSFLLLVGPVDGSIRATALFALDAQGVPWPPAASAPATVPALGPLTWFGVPPTVLSLVAPVTLAVAGLVAGRRTRSATSLVGVRAGAALAVGYGPGLALVAWWVGPSPGIALVVGAGYALVFGGLGGFVGVRT